MKKHFINLQTLFIILSLLLISFNSRAQIENFQVGTTTRSMLVYAPAGIEENRPLLLSLHGLNQDIYYQQNQTQWETVADENGFVLVYPGGINNSWDIYGTGDTDFILAIIEEMYKRYGIDRDRVYLSGFSMGGMMTYHAMNHIADKIAAFAPVSGYLMGGPNTNSSRPVPIIHTHGTSDNVVTYNGVAACMDAWISRNGCPTTPQVTQPYPADKPNSNGTKYYWGPGIDNVEIVLLSLAGVGHWHSLDGNGVHTSREIWNFCKKYSLRYGIPEFTYTSVTEENPKQIRLTLSKSIIDSVVFSGFTVKVDSQIVAIDSVVLGDTNVLEINLSDSILKDNEVTLTYFNGNVYSVFEKALENFSDTIVDNLLIGSSPRIIEVSTNEKGDTVLAKFNKKMQLPADISFLALNAEFEGDFSIPILDCSFFNMDSALLSFSLDTLIYADYEVSITYTGNNISSSDSGLLKIFTNFPVENNAIGLPAKIDTATIGADGSSVFLEFSKPMFLEDDQANLFSFIVNGENVSFQDFFLSQNTVKFVLSNNLHFDDTISVSYNSGDVTAADLGPLEYFSDFEIMNPIAVPKWYHIPGKVEAENYALQSGTDLENTSDAGGGKNVGWIDNGDWLEYAIVNDSSETEYEITFRLASQNDGCRLYFYIDNKREGVISVPNTGSWQTWRSVKDDITLDTGKHYLKVVAITGGFNINYMEIKPFEEVVTDKVNTDQIGIYPNPVSNEIVIYANDFQYDKIEILDVTGKILSSSKTDCESEFHMKVNMLDGIYFVKLSNDDQFRIKKIIIRNN